MQSERKGQLTQCGLPGVQTVPVKSRTEDPRPGDSAPHVTRVARAQLMGEIHIAEDGIDIRDAHELPQTGRPVHVLGADVVPRILGLPVDSDGGLDLGSFESGGRSESIRIPIEALARHITIVGKPGVGKSHAGGVIVEECKRLGIPVVSFDVLGDLTRATTELNGLNYQAGSHDFRIPYSIIGLSEFLAFIPNLTRDQQEIVSAAYDRIHQEALRSLEDSGVINISLSRLLDEIRDVGTATGQSAVASRAQTRVTAFYNRSTLLTTSTQEWLERIKGTDVINVDVGHLPQRQRNLVAAATARMLQTLRRNGEVPPFILVLDEAHLFLPSGGHETPSVPVIRELVQTARHDAIGVLLLTQSPSSMDRQSFLICNTRIVFALDPENLRLVAGHLSDLPEAAVDRIPRMRRGRCILSSAMDVLRHSVQVDVRARRTSSGAPTPNLAKEAKSWRERRI